MTAPPFVISRLTDEAQAAALHALVQGVFGALKIDPPSSMLRETVADVAARLRRETCFVARAEGRLIGSVFCVVAFSSEVDTGSRQENASTQDSRAGAALYIGRLAVAPDWRRRGVAGALIEAAKDEARRLGARRMTLKARIALADNVALFRRHGFAVVAEETHSGYTHPTSYAMELVLK